MKKRAMVLVVLLVSFWALEASAKNRVEHEFRTEIPALGIRRVDIEVPPSEIVIRNGDKDQIVVSGVVKKEFRDERDRENVQQIVNAISMDIETMASRATIRPKYAPNARSRWSRRRSEYRIEILVPVGTHIEVRQSAGEVDVGGEFGDVDIGMRFGEIRVLVPKSSVRELFAKTKIGDVEIDFGDRILDNAGIFPRAVDYTNESGAHELRISLHIGEIQIRLQ